MITAAYMPLAHAVLVRAGDTAIELHEAHAARLAVFLREWAHAPDATIRLSNDGGRLTIGTGQADTIANAIELALRSREIARNLPEAA